MPHTIEPVGLTVISAAAAAGIGRTLIFRAIKEGRLPARKYGRRTIILPDDLRRFLASLPAAPTSQVPEAA